LKKLLVIENDIDTLEMVGAIFEDCGFTVVLSQTEMPVEQIAEVNPDVLIVDYLLSGYLGSNICLDVKTNCKTNHIQVLLFSASHDLGEIAKNCHADGYLEKPFDLNQIVDLVTEMAL